MLILFLYLNFLFYLEGERTSAEEKAFFFLRADENTELHFKERLENLCV